MRIEEELVDRLFDSGEKRLARALLDPFALMGDFHAVYAAIVVVTFLCDLFGLVAGLALLAN